MDGNAEFFQADSDSLPADDCCLAWTHLRISSPSALASGGGTAFPTLKNFQFNSILLKYLEINRSYTWRCLSVMLP